MSNKKQRNYKDTVYRMLFKEPENALSLYNSLNGTAYTDETMLEFNTLENAIYMGMNEELKEKCQVLKEYVAYVEKVREHAKAMTFEDAVEQAIEECIRDNVLREFLLTQKAEVKKMSIYEYDKERELRLIRVDERELGEEIGKEIGREEEKENTIKAIVSLCKKYSGKKEDAVDEVNEKCSLSKEAAQEKVNLYWE